jgi:ribosomal protein S7
MLAMRNIKKLKSEEIVDQAAENIRKKMKAKA